jgi:hypothetical protein
MGPSIPPIAADHINADPLQALIEKSRTNDYSARTTNITVMLTPAAAQRYVSSVCRR